MTRVRYLYPIVPLDYTETSVRVTSTQIGLYQQLRSEMSQEIYVKSIVTGRLDIENS
jgi:hypothetical protein